MKIETFLDPDTMTFTYIVIDEKTQKCAVIDSVLDYDPASGRTATTNADKIIKYIKENKLTNEWLLETHFHADHITASSYLKPHIGGKQAMGSCVQKVLDLWIPRLDTANDTANDGSQFDQLFDEGEKFKIGTLEVTVWHSPGHTPACASYLVEDAIFVGDTMFAPHIGTARCDFPGGSAKDMYNSIQRIYTLPDETRIFLCHDYPEKGVEPVSVVSVGEEKAHNALLRPETSLEEYVKKREARDKSLSTPKLIYPSIQTNMRLGHFGAKAKNGFQFIKTPINAM